MMSTTAGAGTGTAVRERKGTCVAYTPISVCSRNVVSCFRGEEGEEDDSEPAVQVPWIAHVLMGSGEDPDTYLDINLIQWCCIVILQQQTEQGRAGVARYTVQHCTALHWIVHNRTEENRTDRRETVKWIVVKRREVGEVKWSEEAVQHYRAVPYDG
jgi:hypothetical protein